MMNINRIILLILLFAIFPFSVSGFVEDWDTGVITGDWTILSGSYSFPTINHLNHTDAVLKTMSGGENIRRMYPYAVKYFSYEFNFSMTQGSGSTRGFLFEFERNETGISNYMKMVVSPDGSSPPQISSNMAGYVPFSYVGGTWYKVEGTVIGTIISIVISNTTGIINSQTIAKPNIISTDRIQIEASPQVPFYYIDNIIIETVLPSTSTSIYTTPESGVKGDLIAISWDISNIDFDSKYGFTLQKFLDGNQKLWDIFPIPSYHFSVGSQSGTIYEQISETGTWKYQISWGIFIKEVLDDVDIKIGEPCSPYLSIQSSATTIESVPVRFQFGTTPSSNVTGIYTTKINADGSEGESAKWQIDELKPYTACVQYAKNITFRNPGKYFVRLYDGYEENPIAAKYIEISRGISYSRENISLSELKSNDIFVIGTFANISITIDTYNFTRASYQPFLKIRDYASNYSYYSYISTQTSNLVYRIRNYGSTEDISKLHNILNVMPGTSQLSIVLINATSEIQIVSKNVTISNINENGYGIDTFGRISYCKDEDILVALTVPILATFEITDSRGKIVKSISLNRSGIIELILTTPGSYYLILKDLTGENYMSQVIKIKECTVGATPTPGKYEQAATTNEILNLLQLNIFWSLLITIGMMLGIGALATKSDVSAIMPMAMVGFMGLAIFSYIGWLPLWITIGVVLIAAVTFAWSQASKTNTGGSG